MDLHQTYNRIAEDWNKDHANDTWWNMGTNHFLSLLKPGSRILDVGCAGGIKTKYLVGHGMNAEGIDFSESMIEIAKRTYSEIPFEVMDIYDISRTVGLFDGIFVQAVLLHIPKTDVLRVVRGLIEKLNPGGLLYVAVKEQREGNPEEALVTENDYGYDYQRFFSFYTLEELERLMTQAGLNVVYANISPIGSTRWIEMIGKKTA